MSAVDTPIFLKAFFGLEGHVTNNIIDSLSFILHYATSYDDINWNEYPPKELVIINES